MVTKDFELQAVVPPELSFNLFNWLFNCQQSSSSQARCYLSNSKNTTYSRIEHISLHNIYRSSARTQESSVVLRPILELPLLGRHCSMKPSQCPSPHCIYFTIFPLSDMIIVFCCSIAREAVNSSFFCCKNGCLTSIMLIL